MRVPVKRNQDLFFSLRLCLSGQVGRLKPFPFFMVARSVDDLAVDVRSAVAVVAVVLVVILSSLPRRRRRRRGNLAAFGVASAVISI